ncbi:MULTISPECIES: carbon-nitrogen hydrolase family protein [unclassified Lentilitoribacter]|jgi:predicted amidohydrolase|uniref:carbon-nitrogen hydrolase family protein n=1 Tax=unclassified Lentilitoribacter TaxID=2647570 RepID=UPI0013A7045B|nr:carbon-nitrogen hydrolase family protein [Lentilitoribacter sp. Alg239-R112]
MIKAAVVQMRSSKDPLEMALQLEQVIHAAAIKGVEYIQTPEMTGCIHSTRDELYAVIFNDDDDPIVKMASRLSAEHNIIIHIGSTAIALDNGKVANRAFFFQNGNLKARYDKLHMFDVDLDYGESWRESSTYQAGREAVIVEASGAKFGLGICYDVRFPNLFRDQAIAGAQILTAPAAFTEQTGQAHWHVLQRARAIENGAFMISAAQGGTHEDGRKTYGHSLIVSPWGDVLAEVKGNETGIAIADIDVQVSAKARAKIPNLKNNSDYTVNSV